VAWSGIIRPQPLERFYAGAFNRGPNTFVNARPAEISESISHFQLCFPGLALLYIAYSFSDLAGISETLWSGSMKSDIHPLRVLGKALALFLLINLVYALVDPSLGGISAYNHVIPGRVRFPFGSATDPYVVMVDNLDVMAASHAISAAKKPGEYRVVLIGDSSVWGEKISANDSISEQWNGLNLQCNGRQITFYNLGYPHPSIIKDLIVLDKAMQYDPDMIVWFVTLNTLMPRRLSPFLAANSEEAAKVLNTYNIPYSHEDELLMQKPNFLEKTLVGRRSDLARAIKLQALGLLWMATDQDKRASKPLAALSQDVDDDPRFRGFAPGVNIGKKMAFNALQAGHDMAGSVPILIVNEPIFIASGRNSDIRYNDVYPRWAFDQYRDAMAVEAQISQWNYLDLWNAVPDSEFSDTSLHVSAQGERHLIQSINPALLETACP